MKISVSKIGTLILLVAGGLWGQQRNPAVALQPDCMLFFQLSSATFSINYDNRQVGCTTWTVAYQSTGFTVLSLRFESAPALTDSTPDTFVAFAGTVVSGINPNTAITQATSQFSGYYPWIRINATAVTGSGVIRGLFYGYRVSNTANITATISGAIAPTSASSVLGDAVTNTQTTITNAASTILYNRVMQHVFNGATWDRARGDTNGAYVQGNAVAGAGIVASRPVIIGGVDNGGLAQYFATTVTGKVIVAAPLTGVDTLSNTALSQVVNTSASGSGPLSTAPSVFNGTTWDRMRGNTLGSFAQGPAATGAAPSGNPNLVAGLGSGATGGLLMPPTMCDSSGAIAATAGAGATIIISGVSGRLVRICAFLASISLTGTAQFTAGTGAACAGTPVNLTGAIPLVTAVPFSYSTGGGSIVLAAPAGFNVCVTAVTGDVAGSIAYAIY